MLRKAFFIIGSATSMLLGLLFCSIGVSALRLARDAGTRDSSYLSIVIGMALLLLAVAGVLTPSRPPRPPPPVTTVSEPATLGTASYMRNLSPEGFERYIKRLFEKMGYTVQVTKRTGDEGVDLRLTKGGRTAIAQCKRLSGTLGQPIVRDLYGTMIHEGVHEAFLLTTGAISLPARSWAEGKPIRLLDDVDIEEWAKALQGLDNPRFDPA